MPGRSSPNGSNQRPFTELLMSGASVRKGMPSTQLTKEQFRARFLARFFDPAFDPLGPELEHVLDVAWDAYDNYRKAPHTRAAGSGFADPPYELSIDWLSARAALQAAEARHADRNLPSRILLINGSPRSEHTCPG